MRLDPELAVAVADAPETDPLADIPGERAARRAAAVPPPAPDASQLVIRDTRIPSSVGPGEIPIRIYEPVGARAPRPGVVWFHGGGFVFGDLDIEDDRCRIACTTAGAVVVSVDYRLAPEHPFPAGLDDCYAGLEWTVREAGSLGIDVDRVAVAGSSAGGCLAAAVALMARDRDGPALAFQLLRQPVLDDRLDTPSANRCIDGRFWSRLDCQRMWATYLGEGVTEVSPYAAPARAMDLSGLPPAYVQTGELEPMCDEAQEYARRLGDAGVPVELHRFSGAFHGFDSRAPGASVSRRAALDWAEALRDALRG